MSQPEESTPFDIAVEPPAPARPTSVNLASISTASSAAPQLHLDGEGVAVTKPPAEPTPLVSGTVGAVLGLLSMLAAAGAGFASGLVSMLATVGVNLSAGLLQGVLVVVALVAGLAVGKYAVEAPAFAAGKPLVQGPWLALASAGALHLGNLAAVLPPGLGCALAVAGCALCCLLAGLPFSRPVKR